MKNFCLAAFCFACGWIAGTSDCQADTAYIYGPQGQFVGQTITTGNTTYIYDANGNTAATVMVPTSTVMPPVLNQPRAVAIAPVFVAPATPVVPNPASMTPIYDSIFGQ